MKSFCSDNVLTVTVKGANNVPVGEFVELENRAISAITEVNDNSVTYCISSNSYVANLSDIFYNINPLSSTAYEEYL